MNKENRVSDGSDRRWYGLAVFGLGLPVIAVFLQLVGWLFNGRWVYGWDAMIVSVGATLAALLALYVVLWTVDAAARSLFALVMRRVHSSSRRRSLIQELKRIRKVASEAGGGSSSSPP